MLKKNGYLQPVLIQGLGVILLLGFAIFWAVTGNQSELLVGAALILIGVGSATGSIINVRHEIEKPPEEVVKEKVQTNGKPDDTAPP